MKIVDNYRQNDTQEIKIKSADHVGGFTIKITFNDGAEQIIDFKSFLKHAQHPSIRKYLDEELFSKFEIIDGNLNWNDYDLIFPVWDLYNGKV
jgi:Protein of unknown function (DUF2442)